MKSKKKALLLALCALLLVAGSVFGTYAYLTSSDVVKNSFTLGKVNITLDETDVDVYGVKDGEKRVKTNEYKLVPGHSYTKDPVVHLTAGSEASYLFVKLENGISKLESNRKEYVKIADQIVANKWTKLTDDVYYKSVSSKEAEGGQDFTVFENFRIDENFTGLSKSRVGTVIVHAYAVQADGFKEAADAWKTTFGK